MKAVAFSLIQNELEHNRRQNLKVLLALSWLSVETPASLAPTLHIIARSTDPPEIRVRNVLDRFRTILERLEIPNSAKWLEACEPALSARIRDGAVWVDRFSCFKDATERFPGLTCEVAARVLFELLRGATDYFALPEPDAPKPPEPEPFVVKAGNWLSEIWGSGPEADAAQNSRILDKIADCLDACNAEMPGDTIIESICRHLNVDLPENAPVATRLKAIARAVGWKGSPSSERIAIESLDNMALVTRERQFQIRDKCREAAAAKRDALASSGDRDARRRANPWLTPLRDLCAEAIGMPFRLARDHQKEYAVALDHALRRVSAGHTWIKRAEVERRQFKEAAAKLDDTEAVPSIARKWLDEFRKVRAESSGAQEEYLIRRRAIDAWDKVVQAWAELGPEATRKHRIDAAREVQANLDDDDKFGDIQLFAGFGDEDDLAPRACLGDEAARCVWQDAEGRPRNDILKNYVAGTVAEHNQRRFKVPAYRHPDPLRNPIYVDYGDSRWEIEYKALSAAQKRTKNIAKLLTAKTDKAREKLRQQLAEIPDLRGVTLDVWTGEKIETLSLRWQAERFWNHLDLAHFGEVDSTAPVSRADRLGRVVGERPGGASVDVAAVFQQKDWNGRLQAPRSQLSRLADLVYGKDQGKQLEPDYSKLNRAMSDPRARKLWERLNWFLTTSAKLQPKGPWLDYANALPDGIEYREGRSGYYLNYAVNKDRKGRARLFLARLPGLRVLSLDLGHRYAAACAVWQSVSRKQLIDACRELGHAEPKASDLFIHLSRPSDKTQRSGKRKGQPIVEKVIYRRIGPDKLPDGTTHPAPWARLERQFLIKLQGEDRVARKATAEEIAAVNRFRHFLGMRDMDENLRIDDLQRDAVRLARLGMRQFGDMARIAYQLTAKSKPIAGGRTHELSPEERVGYVQDALTLWQGLAASKHFADPWAREQWQSRIVPLKAPQPLALEDDITPVERKRKLAETRGALRPAAEQLADPESPLATKLQKLWADRWIQREGQWREQLRWLRRFLLPRSKEFKENRKSIRGVGGLSVKRLNAIRDLYQILKAFRMRPEPTDLRKNVPELGDESLGKFGRRILDQLERLREQRIKQLASRLIEAALGAGRMKTKLGHDRKRPEKQVDPPCHAVIVENLERYRPEETRLARENRRLMDWAARNVRKYIVEGCQLHGLYFGEVSPSYTSRQDSRTGAPGIRCEEVQCDVLRKAASLALSADNPASGNGEVCLDTRYERSVRRWSREFNRVLEKSADQWTPSERLLAAVASGIASLPAGSSAIRLPRRGGELFVSADRQSPAAKGLQADLNAAANIGIKALMDPDWWGAWWFVLANTATGEAVVEKLQGCPIWDSVQKVLPATEEAEDSGGNKKRSKGTKRAKTGMYAWNSRHWGSDSGEKWQPSARYWDEVARVVADNLRRDQMEPENPF